jgi:GNAT superfamily N-acetyltransferase
VGAVAGRRARRGGPAGRKKKPVSFAGELWLSEGSRSDWPYFARWHYRGHALAHVRRVVVLWHRAEPVGVCVFAPPAAALAVRAAYFGLTGRCRRAALSALNEQLWVLQRVVLHPAYRGAGVAAAFVRRACELCPVDWVETLAAMGHANPVFERAGFTRVGVVRRDRRSGRGAYGRRPGPAVTARPGDPVYYVFDNRGRQSS